jgi:hypothetical protein
MEHQESYHGQPIVVTTTQAATGGWTAVAQLVEGGQRRMLDAGSAQVYASEDQARRAALSAAAGVIDRARSSRGKP